MWLAVVRGMSVQEIASVLFMWENQCIAKSLFHSTGSVAHNSTLVILTKH